MSKSGNRSGAAVRALLVASALAAPFVPLAAMAEGIEVVTVTAEKRAENLQSTPIAITAFTADKIAEQHLAGAEQLQFITPSMTYGQESSYSFITLRGIGTDLTTTSGEPGVATYEDNVYTGSLFQQDVPDFDLERIEVLRGPQGTLYGRNANGGVVNYITKAPSFDPQADGSVTYGDYNTVQIDAGATGALIDDIVAGRFSVRYQHHDGYRQNLIRPSQTVLDTVDDPNIPRGDRLDSLDHIGARASLLIQPDENFSILLRAGLAHEKNTNPYEMITTHSFDPLTSFQTPLGIFSQPAAFFEAVPGLLSPADIAKLNGGSIADFYRLSQGGPNPPNPDETTDVTISVPPVYRTDAHNFSATFDWRPGDVDVKSITAYRYGRLYFIQDSTGFATPEVIFSPLVQDSRQVTQEFNFSGKAFDGRMDWLAGFFYLHEDSHFDTTVFLPASGDATIAAFTLSAIPGCSTAFCLIPPAAFPYGFFQGFADDLTTVTRSGKEFGTGVPLIAGVSTPSTAFLGFQARQTSESAAGFAQITYRLTDALRITGGLRFTDDQKTVVRDVHSNLLETLIKFGLLTPKGLDGADRLCNDQHLDKTWDALTGTAGIDYDVEEGTLVYAKYSRGYKAGGFNPGECGRPFNPEHLTAYETGVKSVFWDGQVLTNAAFYYYDYSDIQFTLFVPNQSYIRNAGSGQAYGVELEYQFVPKALEGFEFDGAASYEHSEYGNGLFQDVAGLLPCVPAHPGGSPIDPNTGGCAAGGIQIGGNSFIRAPDWKLSLGAQYGTELGDWGVVQLRVDAAYSDKYFNDIFDGKGVFNGTRYFDEATTQPSYWVANARVTFTPADSPFEAQLFVNNFTNTFYATNRVSFNTPTTLDSVAGQYAAPRTFGIRLSAKFGGAQ